MLPKQSKQLELIETLSKDTSGAVLKSLSEKLELGRIQTRRTIDAGVPPGEYQSLSKLALAYDLALELLPDLWSHSQKL